MTPEYGPFSFEYPDHQFVFFSQAHILILLALILIYAALWFTRKSFAEPKLDKISRWTIAAILILQELSLSIWRLYHGVWELGTSLPLHLCGAGIVLAAFMLVNRSYLLYELVYFWGFGGAIQALLTPNIGEYGFPHYRYFQFFVSHGTLIFASLYLTWVGGMRPRHRSIWKVMGITNLYMIAIAGFNALTGGNYLFICWKPETGSLLDVLGPWPWYILSLEVVALISFYVYYAPFAVQDLLKKFRTS